MRLINFGHLARSVWIHLVLVLLQEELHNSQRFCFGLLGSCRSSLTWQKPSGQTQRRTDVPDVSGGQKVEGTLGAFDARTTPDKIWHKRGAAATTSWKGSYLKTGLQNQNRPGSNGSEVPLQQF